ncbi:xanthine dehydrogenase family protein molybdopterin-binding subunit [Halodurantibacterium flavum]|uniref:Xanthine dehydrogenase family protein molybdopterin-binding subunit n=1 Tax=Halodurantibacterium flavum TaxID=1382802 RepID=A0ABW4S6H9_9RHOB
MPPLDTAKPGIPPGATARATGQPLDRIDGPDKVTGRAVYAGDIAEKGLLYGMVVNATIPRGRIVALDIAPALRIPGVVEVFSHLNRPDLAWFNSAYEDDDAPPGTHFRPLYDDRVHWSGQPIALVVAEDFETARHAAGMIGVTYESEPHEADLYRAAGNAHVPRQRSSINPSSRGRADLAMAEAALRVEGDYTFGYQFHNPMEMHASTVLWRDGALEIWDKTQSVVNSRDYVCRIFGLKPDQVRVRSPYVGGAFGSGLRPQYQLFMAVMAAQVLGRSVRVVLSREQMFTFGYRPLALQQIALGADANGHLTAIRHDAVQNTSRLEEYQENIVPWSGLIYQCPNVTMKYRLAELDLYTPLDTRAPGAATGVNAFEQAIDAMAHEAGIDPLEFRLINYAERDQTTGMAFTSKQLRACYATAAERFGWSARKPLPRSMREGRELIGWGVATGVWEAMQMNCSARAVMGPEGLMVELAASDIGTGTYTILAQIAAETMGVDPSEVDVRIADSDLPKAPLQGGSAGAATFGSAVKAACETLRETLSRLAVALPQSPLAGKGNVPLQFEGGTIRAEDGSAELPLADLIATCGAQEARADTGPSTASQMRYSRYSHSAVMAEVRVDEELGQIRVTRVVGAVAAGRILNPKTAASQVSGGIVWGIGKALHEEGLLDERLGRFMNHNFAEYHIPVNADIPEIDVIFVPEEDPEVNALGIKGVGEIGVVGTAAAIANAVFHATGRRVGSLPITPDKLL